MAVVGAASRRRHTRWPRDWSSDVCSSDLDDPLELLSDRELEVFELTGKGKTTREIAEKLHVSVKTVESYRARIKEKMDLKSANDLLRRAVQWSERLSI